MAVSRSYSRVAIGGEERRGEKRRGEHDHPPPRSDYAFAGRPPLDRTRANSRDSRMAATTGGDHQQRSTPHHVSECRCAGPDAGMRAVEDIENKWQLASTTMKMLGVKAGSRLRAKHMARRCQSDAEQP